MRNFINFVPKYGTKIVKNMETVIINAEINKEDLPFVEKFLDFLKAKSIKIEEKDPTKMTKKEFFEMIDKARKEPSRRVSTNEIKEIFGI